MAGLLDKTVSTANTPSTGRIVTILEAIETQIEDSLDAVRFDVIVPEVSEKLNKVVYLEMDLSDIEIESLMGSQQSFTPLKIFMTGFIRDSDPKVGLNFMEETLKNTVDATAIAAYDIAFDSGTCGFSIETIEGIGVEHSTSLGTQFRCVFSITLDLPQQA